MGKRNGLLRPLLAAGLGTLVIMLSVLPTIAQASNSQRGNADALHQSLVAPTGPGGSGIVPQSSVPNYQIALCSGSGYTTAAFIYGQNEVNQWVQSYNFPLGANLIVTKGGGFFQYTDCGWVQNWWWHGSVAIYEYTPANNQWAQWNYSLPGACSGPWDHNWVVCFAP
jgi:hypothetical protein